MRMMDNSIVVRKERCPECARLGKDTSHDNLVSYSDGHSYCYGCGYYVPGSKIEGVKRRSELGGESNYFSYDSVVRLPSDTALYINAPRCAKEWLNQYHLSQNQMIAANIMWSERRQRLIFPYFINGELVAWQGRWFGEEKAPKWYTDGKIDKFIYILGPNKGTIVLTEDIISAIRCSRFCAASPLFGSVVSAHRFKGLRQVADKVVLWLDPDKQKEAVKFANLARVFGLDASVILSDKDPKEYDNYELQVYLGTKSSETD